jgi:FtsH-binding integral membrane protein
VLQVWSGQQDLCRRQPSDFFKIVLTGGMDGETSERSAILGALSLYLNFINIFTLLLQLFGQRDE